MGVTNIRSNIFGSIPICMEAWRKALSFNRELMIYGKISKVML